jgi:hypothetical protein
LPDPRSLLNFRRKAPTARPPAGLLGFLRRRPFWHMLIDTAQRPVGELAEIIIQRQRRGGGGLFVAADDGPQRRGV